MPVYVQRGQGADVNLVLARLRQLIGHLLVQAVDALDDKDVVLSQLQIVSSVLTLANLEIEGWQLHPLPRQKLYHIIIELLHVNGFQAFKIVVPVLVPGCLLPVHEIIVQGDRPGHLSHSPQLDGQPVGKAGLA